jgi:cytochrome c oxidase assembly factor CtaG
MPALGHVGAALAPHDLSTAWNADPVLLAVLALCAWAYARGRAPGAPRPRDRWRAGASGVAFVALLAAFVSPLEALAGALASAHMVQHLLLTLVAAPLLAYGAPWSRLLRGSPLPLRRGLGRGRRALGLRPAALRSLGSPAVAWLLHVGAVWLWHAAALYDASLAHPVLHVLEHATFLVTGVLLWRHLVGSRAARVSPGFGILIVFALGMQSVFLSLLLTFAHAPFYEGYASTTAAWGLSPLADQQLAGAIMWIPAGLVHLAIALLLLRRWLGPPDEEDAGSGSRGVPAYPSSLVESTFS